MLVGPSSAKHLSTCLSPSLFSKALKGRLYFKPMPKIKNILSTTENKGGLLNQGCSLKTFRNSVLYKMLIKQSIHHTLHYLILASIFISVLLLILY